MSPYTVKKKSNFFIPWYVIIVIIIVVLLLGGYFLFSNIKGNDFADSDITYVIRR